MTINHYSVEMINRAAANSQWFSIAQNPKEAGWYLTLNEIGEFAERRYSPETGWDKGKVLKFWNNIFINIAPF